MVELCEWIEEDGVEDGVMEHCRLMEAMDVYTSCGGVVEMCNCEGMRLDALRSEAIDRLADAEREEGKL